MARQAWVFTARGVGARVLVAVMLVAGHAAARPEVPAAPRAGRIIAGLDEPFVATRPTSAEDDRALDRALAAFRIAAAKAPADALSYLAPLARFVETHPDSGWNAAVLTNLGIVYHRAGYFGRALDSWQAAWRDGHDATGVPARALADRALSELARMHLRLGHVNELESLVKEARGRPLGDAGAAAVASARESAAILRRDPGAAYRCGPNALGQLLIARGAASDAVAFLGKERSGPHGFSLWQLGRLAERAGLPYRLIHREPGQAIPVPSIVHWNVHHFAAIVGARAGGYLVRDSALGFGSEELWIREAAIDTETSGFFLVPSDAAQDARWREATSAEASRISGTARPPGNACPGRAGPTSSTGTDTHADLIVLAFNDRNEWRGRGNRRFFERSQCSQHECRRDVAGSEKQEPVYGSPAWIASFPKSES